MADGGDGERMMEKNYLQHIHSFNIFYPENGKHVITGLFALDLIQMEKKIICGKDF